MNYSTQFTQIQNTLDKCGTISTTYNYPESDLEGYPAVVYFPDDFENSFSTVAENEKIYRWKLWVIVKAGGAKNTQTVMDTILADTVDEVVNQFDADWDGGRIDGNRVSSLLDSGVWAVNENEDGKVAFAELNLRIKVNTSN